MTNIASVVSRALGSAGLIVFSFTYQAAAASLSDFPPDMVQRLQMVWRALPSDARQMDLIAIGRLPRGYIPAAIAAYRQLYAPMPNNTLIGLAKINYGVMKSLPRNMQQTFVDGYWGVSLEEHNFTQQVLQAQAQANAQPPGLPPPGRGLFTTDNLGRTAPSQASPYPNGMHGVYDALGGTQTYVDPKDPNYSTGVPTTNIPNGSTAQRCNEQAGASFSMSGVGLNCRELVPSR